MMKRFTLPVCLLLVLRVMCVAAQGTMGGKAAMGDIASTGADATAPVISGLAVSPDANTIVATWNTSGRSSSSLACGTSSGSYTIRAVDNGVELAVLAHSSVVEGLTPSTAYYCQVTSSNSLGTASQTFTATTSAPPVTTPITSLSFGTITDYNTLNANNQMAADTYYNCKSNDGFTYLTSNDSYNWTQSGAPSGSSNAQIVKFTSESPLAGQTINQMAGLGPEGGVMSPDSRSIKNDGLFCMNGMVFMGLGRQENYCCGSITTPYFPQTTGTVIWSPDHGQTWNSYGAASTFTATGVNTGTASMFAGTPITWGSATFIMYCGDDGTWGYRSTCNREDNANAFVYMIANDDKWNNGNVYYLARVPRKKIPNLNAGDWQFFTGGDGSKDANWSSNESAVTPILSNSGELSYANVQYVPALNRYILMTFYYPGGLQASNVQAENSTWLTYESPHPWGPWTLVNTTNWTTQGYYNPIVLNDTIWTGTTTRIMFTGDFQPPMGFTRAYRMFFTTMTIN
jgi:hypothetical protein